jgi:hypothetical protein
MVNGTSRMRASVVASGVVQPLVMIVDGDRENLLGVILPDHIVVQHLVDFERRRHAIARLHQRGFVFLADDVHAKLDAFVADEDRRTGDQLPHFVLALAAEGAVESVFALPAATRSADLAHTDPRSAHPCTNNAIRRSAPTMLTSNHSCA